MANSQIISCVSSDGSEITIVVRGEFGFRKYAKFRAAYEQGGEATRYVVDLKEADTIDSSALGMLIVLRDHVGGDATRLEIVNCSARLRRIFEIANFHRLFTLRDGPAARRRTGREDAQCTPEQS
jgi:anti-anti-sigma factor